MPSVLEYSIITKSKYQTIAKDYIKVFLVSISLFKFFCIVQIVAGWKVEWTERQWDFSRASLKSCLEYPYEAYEKSWNILLVCFLQHIWLSSPSHGGSIRQFMDIHWSTNSCHFAFEVDTVVLTILFSLFRRLNLIFIYQLHPHKITLPLFVLYCTRKQIIHYNYKKYIIGKKNYKKY